MILIWWHITQKMNKEKKVKFSNVRNADPIIFFLHVSAIGTKLALPNTSSMREPGTNPCRISSF
jgi:hypothetical protein